MADLSTLSDEELDAIIAGKDVTQAPPGAGMQVLGERNRAVAEKVARKSPPTLAEEIEPSAFRRGAAALGGRLREPFVGLAEKAQLAFPGRDDDAAKATHERIGQERSSRRDIQRQLEATPAGQFGGFVGQAAPFVAVPYASRFVAPFSRTGGEILSKTISPVGQSLIAGTQGFLTGGADQPSGIGSELATSAMQGGVDAAVTGGTMKGLQLAGKGIAGAQGRYTPEGRRAMELDAAAERLGLQNPTIGQLDPLAPESLRAHPELAMQQAAQLEQRMGAKRQVPSAAGGMEEQVVPGGMLKAGLEDAINARKAEARSMYSAVDDYVQANNLPNISPNYTVNTLQGIAKRYVKPGQSADQNKIFKMLDAEDPQAFAWLKAAGSPKAAKQAGMDFTSYQDARTLVNGVLTDLRAIKPANRKGWQNDAIKDLDDLVKAMDNDANRWATANKGNKEAVDLFNRAKDFYRTVVAPTTKSTMAAKASLPLGHKAGYESVERMYADIVNPANRSLIDRLLPTASPETRDMLNVLQNLPDVGRVVAKGSVPSSASRSGLTALAAGAAGHPGLALMELAPGLRWLSSRRPTKNVYFGAPPTSPALAPAGQYVAQPTSENIDELLSLPSR